LCIIPTLISRANIKNSFNAARNFYVFFSKHGDYCTNDGYFKKKNMKKIIISKKNITFAPLFNKAR